MLAAVSDSADSPAGTVRINALQAAARWLLRHVVLSFLDRYPRVALDIVSEDRLIDIIAEGFDAGVRLRESVPQDMIAVPFGGDARFLAVASPAYLVSGSILT
jgi:DNA-binding transcriptional LysR family regulator